MNWKPISGPIERKVLVTNNLKARDAHGQMSHIWISIHVQKNGNQFVSMDANSWQKVENLSHYAEIPE